VVWSVFVRADPTRSRRAEKPRRRRGELAVFASLLVAASGAAGCAMPLLHPLRATNGWAFEVATSVHINSGRQGKCYEGCQPTTGGGATFNVGQGSIGYSHVWDGWFGTMIGVYGPAFENQKSDYGFAALWSYFTAQNDYVAAGIGPEVGPGGGAFLVGLDVQPLGVRRWTPSLGVYGRAFFPFEPTNATYDGRVIVLDYGARARIGPLLFEYSYYHPTKSLMEYALFPESSIYVEAYHILTLGMSFDEITRRVFAPQ
jgi:hypothetical protein